MDGYFADSLEHLQAEIVRTELKLRLHLANTRRANNQSTDDKYRGLYISDKEIDAIITGSPFGQGESKPRLSSENGTVLAEALRLYEDRVIRTKQESLKRGVMLRLCELEKKFSLSAFNVEVLLVCLLPELGLKYQKLYAYLQDDITKKSPTIEFVLRLLCDSFEGRITARQAFTSQSPLIKNNLLRLSDDHQRQSSILGRFVQVDERITSYLLGSDHIDSLLLSFAQIIQPKGRLDNVILPDDVKQHLLHLIVRFKKDGLFCYLQGSRGTGKQTAAEAVCSELGIPLLKVEFNNLLSADIPPGLSTRLIYREVLLQGAALYLDAGDTLNGEDRSTRSTYRHLLETLEYSPHWVFLAGENIWEPALISQNKLFVHVEFPTPAYSARIQFWERQLNGESEAIDITELAGKFRLNGGQIADAMANARSLALWNHPENETVTMQDLYSACRQQSEHSLSTLAHKIEPRYGWDDIVLPKDQMEQLREICNYVKNYHRVYSDWGFGHKLSRSKGLNLLFAGPSGTGKTMAAEIMSNELGLDLYKIDLSAIVSKYIGETEKNLERIFKEGQASNAILFFDEADALFGKRSEVRDSHDRYANVEVAYLLQRMEDYDGVVILATNLRKNMDEAFARRMHFTIEFPLPEEPDRYRIWQSVFPEEAPRAKSIDLTFMARQFKITGGNIKNIALGAAFLAAQDGGCITMEDLIRATKREYQKIGKLCTEGDFAQYFDLVRG
jgi:ATP-dependent 26S proteasome regulatory subunit